MPAATSAGSTTISNATARSAALTCGVAQELDGDLHLHYAAISSSAAVACCHSSLTSSLSAGQPCLSVSLSACWRIGSSRAGSELAIQRSSDPTPIWMVPSPREPLIR